MTRDEIIAKWAGLSARERDAWTAEVVFGLSIEGDILASPFAEDRPGDYLFVKVGTHNMRLPHYTADISAAWAVFEKLRENWLPGIQDCAMFGFRVDLQSGHEYRADVGGIVAETAPEAICLAAIISKLTEASADVAV